MAEGRSRAMSSMLLAQKSLRATARKRLDPHEFVTINPALRQEHEADGWVVDRILKKSIRMRRLKRDDVAFEDRVWATFANLNFPYLNSDREFFVDYGEAPSENKRLAVFAADDEVVLVVECKSDSKPVADPLTAEIEAIQRTRQGIIRSVRAEFPKCKVKFIFATNNLVLSRATLECMDAADIVHLDEDSIEYYLDLAKHLGKAARFQLLGRLFAGTKIPGLKPTVGAIEGRMGGHRYYAFMIEPARLLKLAYILHRDKANSPLMPTYQRLDQKGSPEEGLGLRRQRRLLPQLDRPQHRRRATRAQVRQSAHNCGWTEARDALPSSDIPVGLRRRWTASTVRIRRLQGSRTPSSYQSSRSCLSRGPSRFVCSCRSTRTRRPSPRTCATPSMRTCSGTPTISAERARALRLRLAQHLEEKKTSPLHGRIIVGEDRATELRCITIDALSRGVDRGRYIGSFTGKEIKEAGSFYRSDQDATFRQVAAVPRTRAESGSAPDSSHSGA